MSHKSKSKGIQQGPLSRRKGDPQGRDGKSKEGKKHSRQPAARKKKCWTRVGRGSSVLPTEPVLPS